MLEKQPLLHAYKFLTYCFSERLFNRRFGGPTTFRSYRTHLWRKNWSLSSLNENFPACFFTTDGHDLSLTYLQVCGLNLPSLLIGSMPGTLRMRALLSWLALIQRSLSRIVRKVQMTAQACTIAYTLWEHRIWDWHCKSQRLSECLC